MGLTYSYEIANLALGIIGERGDLTSLSTTGASKGERECAKWFTICRDQLLGEFNWNFAKASTKPVLESGYSEYYDKFGGTAPVITAITQGSPPIVTATAHGIVTGDHVLLEDVSGMTEVDEQVYHATKVDADTFSLTGIDATNFTAYASGGKVYKIQPQSDYHSGYTYALPSDYIKARSLDGDYEYELLNGDLVTTQSDPVLIYTKKVETVASFSDTFIELLAYKLAMAVLPAVIGLKDTSEARSALVQLYHQLAKPKVEAVEAKEYRKPPATTGRGTTWMERRKTAGMSGD